MLDGTDNPTGKSFYTLSVRFDEHLIKAFQHSDIENIDDFMNNVPTCCQINKLKKILWEAMFKPAKEDSAARVKTAATVHLNRQQQSILEKEKSKTMKTEFVEF